MPRKQAYIFKKSETLNSTRASRFQVTIQYSTRKYFGTGR
ncbi:hypothetical protein PITC_075890 [Penicillium italicum]|uniref:Uncharacterized protein n=1 Tax=Penicillium italicum TaxID=40296 RepID=A0A0A2KZ36_PENIT|nr:hypothetical protein PITC_075890 [Penicillium italicum]